MQHGKLNARLLHLWLHKHIFASHITTLPWWLKYIWQLAHDSGMIVRYKADIRRVFLTNIRCYQSKMNDAVIADTYCWVDSKYVATESIFFQIGQYYPKWFQKAGGEKVKVVQFGWFNLPFILDNILCLSKTPSLCQPYMVTLMPPSWQSNYIARKECAYVIINAASPGSIPVKIDMRKK